MNGCDRYADLVAGYGFDALTPDEQARFVAHLPGCLECAEAVSELRALRPLLDLAGGVEATSPEPPAMLEASVLAAIPRQPTTGRLTRPSLRRSRPGAPATVARPSRGRRLVPVLALAALVTILGVSVLAPGRSAPSGFTLTLADSGVQPRAHAVALIRYRPWGTEVELSVKHLAPTRGPEIYEAWFVSPYGRMSAGTFTVGASGHAQVTLAAGAHRGGYRTLGITLEPDGLHPGRHGPNILRARLPT
jgi:hypothetical protein